MSRDAVGGPDLHVVTGDPEVATEVFRRGFPGIGLRAIEDRRDFRFDYRRATDGRLAVNRVRLTGAAEGRGTLTGVVAAARVRSGRVRVEYGRTPIDTTRPYLRPAGTSVLMMEDADVELIELDASEYLLAAARRIEGSGRVLVPPSPSLAAPTSLDLLPAWQQLTDHVAATAFDSDAFASPLVRAGLFDLVLAGLLTTFPLTAERGTAGPTGVHPSAVRRALAHIDEHLADPIGVDEIAAAARLSPRGLHAAFRRHVGVTPMEQVRLRRLAAVREELLSADGSDGVTVAEVARRWGFGHLPRFAARYRAAYGENPSQTLRR